MWLTEMWDRLLASDPGLTRLRQAGSAAIGVASTLAVEYVLALTTHAGPKGTIIFMLFGAIVAMQGMMALSGTDTRLVKIRIAIFFPVAIGIGLVAGTLVNRNTDLMLAVFVVVMFAAVAVRQFGISFFFYGFMGWMGYFFASFMGATFAVLPGMFVAIIAATLWIILLSQTALRPSSARALQRTLRGLNTRARSINETCTELLQLESPHQRSRLLRRLRKLQVQLSETALMIEGWSAEPGALPTAHVAALLRRKVVDLQQALDRLAASTEVLMDSPVKLRLAAATATEQLASQEDSAVASTLRTVAETIVSVDLIDTEEVAANMFMETVVELAELKMEAVFRRTPIVHSESSGVDRNTAERNSDHPEPYVNEFEPVVGLFMGNLPGSPAVAQDVPAIGTRWNPLARLSLVNRQAIQVAIAGAIAIVAGRAISPQRYYWAVIAAFVMFAGTATRTESFIKGLNRVVGTLVGLVASVWIAELTAGHTLLVLLVIVLSVFFGFYLFRISYAYMIFFITIMLGQLYSILHEFSTGLMVLRLEETVVGAAAGFIAALLVLPLSTRDTVRMARKNLLLDLADFLRKAADKAGGKAGPDANLDALSLSLDNRMRQLALVAKPLTRPFIWGYSPHVRHRLVLYAALNAGARSIAVALRDGSGVDVYPGVDEKLRELAQFAEEYADTGKLAHRLPVKEGQGDRAVSKETDLLWAIGMIPRGSARASSNPLRRRLRHIRRLLHDLAESHSDPL